ncbi:MAG: sigma-54-dependent Fis family transcriptional regulator, partial [Rhodocyclaceae bacterium]|nr:sigma-54-dependent Fis family transcriptional regulator [Rhodocyclaceae bacterium]
MNEPKPRVLVVDDEPNLRKVLGAMLQQAGHEVVTEADGESALARVKSSPRGTFDAVISDLRMPPGMDGMELLRKLQEEDQGLPVIILTAHGSVDAAVEAVKSGAHDFLEKPFDRDQIATILGKAIATRRRSGPRTEPVAPDPATPVATVDDGMVGRSDAMIRVKEMIKTVAASPSTVLITGE